MTPASPKIYHILHLDRLPSVLTDNRLICDAQMMRRPGRGTTIGMSTIKQRRLVLPVDCHTDTYVGEYVPFYFCPRSIMLYLIHRANHAELSYTGGQGPILHLEADLLEVVEWAASLGQRWAFSLSNAGAHYAQFRNDLAQLNEVRWDCVQSTNFSSPEVKEGKQAEFLMHEAFPWDLIRRVGVHSQAVGNQVTRALTGAAHKPAVQVVSSWYY